MLPKFPRVRRQTSASSSSSGLARRSTSSTSSSTANNGASNVSSNSNDNDNTDSDAIPSRNPLLDSLLHPLRWLLKPRTVYFTPDADARKFVEGFTTRYGDGHPQFVQRSYVAAVRQAHLQGQFLLVYLHSPMHENTDAFCRNILRKPNLARTWDNSFVCWSGSVHDVDAYNLSVQLQVTSYPFLALLVAKNEREVMVADKVHGGVLTENMLLQRFHGVTMRYQSHITQIQNQQRQRAESMSLRQEQDREYRESEQQDRLRREQREREEQEQREAEQIRIQQAQEEEQRAAASAANKATILQQKRERVQPEPAVGGDSGGDVCTLRLQLPSGMKLNRRFLKHNTVNDLTNWLDVHLADSDTTLQNYVLSTAYPKKELTDGEATFESLGLHPRGMLYMADLDA